MRRINSLLIILLILSITNVSSLSFNRSINETFLTWPEADKVINLDCGTEQLINLRDCVVLIGKSVWPGDYRAGTIILFIFVVTILYLLLKRKI